MADKRGDDKTKTAVKVPGDQGPVEKAAAPIAAVSSHADPWPHYLMGTACTGAAGYSFLRANNPRMAAIKAALGAAYFYGGRLLVTGDPKLGYDIGSMASIALTAVAGPAAMAQAETLNVAMASLGGISTVANLIKSYEIRTGRPKEAEVRHERA